jgi:hypothetical protein
VGIGDEEMAPAFCSAVFVCGISLTMIRVSWLYKAIVSVFRALPSLTNVWFWIVSPGRLIMSFNPNFLVKSLWANSLPLVQASWLAEAGTNQERPRMNADERRFKARKRISTTTLMSAFP